MPRWEADTERRLRQSAVELFADRGYDSVSVDAIAGHAGLTRRTFFRYFADKRDVLFPRADGIGDAVRRAIQAQPDDVDAVGLIDVVLAVLTEVGEFITADPAAQRRRRQIIAGSAELQERERTKLAHAADAIEEALVSRRVSGARLTAAIAIELFHAAYEATLSGEEPAAFATRMDDGRRTVQRFALDRRRDRPPGVPGEPRVKSEGTGG